MITLFDELSIRSLTLANRIVMSPMTRAFSPGGVPGPDVAAYYERRARGGTGLIITEGVAIDHPSSVDHTDVPRMFGSDALDGWRDSVARVHAAGGRIVPQLWHVGPLWGVMQGGDATPMRPSGLWGTPGVTSYPSQLVERLTVPHPAMTDTDIASVIEAYRAAARNAIDAGFDGIAIHGGHGYLLDSFMWADTNRRNDRWGGDLARRAAFPSAVVAAIRKEIGDDLPIFYRFSQHKQQDYKARIAETPDDLAALLTPLVESGVDVLDASARRFHLPAFPGSDLSLAGWAKKLTGARSMAVGSFGIDASLRESRTGSGDNVSDNRSELVERLASDEFDLIAIGRLHLADASIAQRLSEASTLPVFDRETHEYVLS